MAKEYNRFCLFDRTGGGIEVLTGEREQQKTKDGEGWSVYLPAEQRGLRNISICELSNSFCRRRDRQSSSCEDTGDMMVQTLGHEGCQGSAKNSPNPILFSEDSSTLEYHSHFRGIYCGTKS